MNVAALLEIIASNEYGENVLEAIVLLLLYLNRGVDGVTDLTIELNKIQTSRYGAQIRTAIHDALYKLSLADPEPKSEPFAYVGRGLPNGGVFDLVIGVAMEKT